MADHTQIDWYRSVSQENFARVCRFEGLCPMSSFRHELLDQFQLNDMLRLLEHASGVYFFIKDSRGRHVAVNSLLLERLGFHQNTDLVGSTDHDLFPRLLADYFVQDDQRVLQTGRSITDSVEAWRNGEPIVTSKFPIRDKADRVIGIAGIFQVYQKARAGLPDLEMQQTASYLRSHLHERMSVEELAERSLLSVPQFSRRFRKEFGMSIQEFRVKERINGVRQALIDTDAPIIEIAGMFGFCDQSALTRQFRQHTGVTPLKFRQRAHELTSHNRGSE